MTSTYALLYLHSYDRQILYGSLQFSINREVNNSYYYNITSLQANIHTQVEEKSKNKKNRKEKLEHWASIHLYPLSRRTSGKIAMLAACTPPGQTLILQAQSKIQQHPHECNSSV